VAAARLQLVTVADIGEHTRRRDVSELDNELDVKASGDAAD